MQMLFKKISGLTLLLSLFINCSVKPYLIDENRLNEIKSKEHAFIEFYFREKDDAEDVDVLTYTHNKWGARIFIDDEIFVNKIFKSGEKFKIPVKAGKVIIKYFIFNQGYGYFKDGVRQYDIQYAADHFLEFPLDAQPIEINLKKNQIAHLKIINIYKRKLGCTFELGIPWVKYYQDVAFTVDKIEALKNEK